MSLTALRTAVGWGAPMTPRAFLIATVAGALCSAALSTAASATSFLLDHGDTTLDSNSGLEWLDLTLTNGKSHDDIVGGYGGYLTSGWRYASMDELIQLFNDGGGSGTYTQFEDTLGSNPTYQLAVYFAGLLGKTTGSDFSDFSGVGLLSDQPAPGSYRVGGFGGFVAITSVVSTSDLSEYIGFIEPDYDVLSETATDQGSFLVRTATVTPIPATLPLFLTALAGMGLVARRSRRAR